MQCNIMTFREVLNKHIFSINSPVLSTTVIIALSVFFAHIYTHSYIAIIISYILFVSIIFNVFPTLYIFEEHEHEVP